MGFGLFFLELTLLDWFATADKAQLISHSCLSGGC